MAKPGPKPTPTKTLKLRGSWRAGERKDEPQPAEGIPDKPEWLSDHASIIWDQMCEQIDSMGLLTKVDGNPLARYCTLWVRWREAEDHIAEKGMVCTLYNLDGQIIGAKAWPHVRIASDLSNQLYRLEQQFGIGPANRVGLSVEKKLAEITGKKRFFA